VTVTVRVKDADKGEGAGGGCNIVNRMHIRVKHSLILYIRNHFLPVWG
jgi:hypothetical protein